MAKVEVVKSEKANTPNYSWVVAVLIFVGIAVYSSLSSYDFGSSSSDSKSDSKISGCYYITNHIFEGRNTSLCINKSSVTFNHEGSSVTLYPNWIGETLYIENEYGNTMFRCTSSKESSSNIQCSSNNKAIGSGTNVWKKK